MVKFTIYLKLKLYIQKVYLLFRKLISNHIYIFTEKLKYIKTKSTWQICILYGKLSIESIDDNIHKTVGCGVPSAQSPAAECGGMEVRWCQWRRVVPVDGASRGEVSALSPSSLPRQYSRRPQITIIQSILNVHQSSV